MIDIEKYLKEDNGNYSSMRLMLFIVIILFTLVVSFGFIYVLFVHPDKIEMYLISLIGVILGGLGIKTWSKGKEQKVDENEKPA